VRFLERTLATYQRNEIITPYLEEALLRSDWPEEYPVKVYNKERKFDNMYHPSSDISLGELQLYYKFHPELRQFYKEEPISPTLQMTFQVGSAFHSIIQSMLIHLGFTTEDKVEVKVWNEDRMVAGAIDILELTTPDGEKFLIDIKSCNKLPNEASYQYSMQLRVYQDNHPDAPGRMALLFIEKSYPHRMRAIEVNKDESELNKLYDKWSRVRVAIRDNSISSLNPCCEGPTSENFSVCPARTICEAWSK
jgi:PD-(D/E)XK nuclease superfamily